VYVFGGDLLPLEWTQDTITDPTFSP